MSHWVSQTSPWVARNASAAAPGANAGPPLDELEAGVKVPKDPRGAVCAEFDSSVVGGSSDSPVVELGAWSVAGTPGGEHGRRTGR